MNKQYRDANGKFVNFDKAIRAIIRELRAMTDLANYVANLDLSCISCNNVKIKYGSNEITVYSYDTTNRAPIDCTPDLCKFVQYYSEHRAQILQSYADAENLTKKAIDLLLANQIKAEKIAELEKQLAELKK